MNSKPSMMRRTGNRGFTLVELLVSMGVLALLMVLITSLFRAAMAVTSMGTGHIDSDAEARSVFDRMSIDFAQMVRRSDVDYYLKTATPDQYGNTQPQPGNDQFAFYSQVPGYFAGSGAGSGAQQSPVSLVGYRVNTDATVPNPYFNTLQRYGFGLLWNGALASGSSMAVVFSSGTAGGTPVAGTSNAIFANWPAATGMNADGNYELAGPEIFRMEYYYVLKGQIISGVTYSSILSDTPWDARIPGHAAINGLQDVAAIGVVMAVINTSSRAVVTNDKLSNLAAQMQDFSAAAMPNPGDIQTQWQAAIENPSNGIPRMAVGSIRVYARTFYLPPRF